MPPSSFCHLFSTEFPATPPTSPRNTTGDLSFFHSIVAKSRNAGDLYDDDFITPPSSPDVSSTGRGFSFIPSLAASQINNKENFDDELQQYSVITIENAEDIEDAVPGGSADYAIGLSSDDEEFKADDKEFKAEDEEFKADDEEFKADDEEFKAEDEEFKAAYKSYKSTNTKIINKGKGKKRRRLLEASSTGSRRTRSQTMSLYSRPGWDQGFSSRETIIGGQLFGATTLSLTQEVISCKIKTKNNAVKWHGEIHYNDIKVIQYYFNEDESPESRSILVIITQNSFIQRGFERMTTTSHLQEDADSINLYFDNHAVLTIVVNQLKENELLHRDIFRYFEKNDIDESIAYLLTLQDRDFGMHSVTNVSPRIQLKISKNDNNDTPLRQEEIYLLTDHTTNPINIIEDDKALFTYPFTSNSSEMLDQVTISTSDIIRTKPRQFLNDNLINLCLKFFSNVFPSSLMEKVHFFNTYFYSLLSQKDSLKNFKRGNHTVDIFTKHLIFVPINHSLHWSVAVICNPGFILLPPTSIDTKEENKNHIIHLETPEQVVDISEEPCNQLVPCILLMDSLGFHAQLDVLGQLRCYLEFEWKRTRGNERIFDENTLPAIIPKLPIQTNSCDCGVFVLMYILMTLQTCSSIKLHDLSNQIPDLHDQLFTQSAITKLRKLIHFLIDTLYQQQQIQQIETATSQVEKIEFPHRKTRENEIVSLEKGKNNSLEEVIQQFRELASISSSSTKTNLPCGDFCLRKTL